MVRTSSSMGIFGLMMHQCVPSLRLMHLSVPTRACQSSLGPLSIFRRVKLCQFSAYLVLAVFFLLVEDPRICPRIHLPGGSSSGRSVKAMKKWSLAALLVPKF